MSKIQDFLDKYFHKIFNNSHFLYTIIFFLIALLIALMSLIPGQAIGNFILFFAATFALTFIFLMFEGLIPQLEKYLFSAEKKFDRMKIIFFLVNFLISLALTLSYFIAGGSTQIRVQFLGWDIVLPVIFIVVYFGWNLIQIFYLRIGFENLSVKTNEKIVDSLGVSTTKELVDVIMLVLALVTPVLLQLGTFFMFVEKFNQPPEDFTLFVAVNIIIGLVIIFTSWRLGTLFYRSKKMNSSNSYSSMFYILIWLVIWFRSFSFLNSLQGVIQSSADLEIISRLIDILLMVITALLVLRSIGDKVYDSLFFKANNMPFFLFAFTLLYIEGQIIMITGAGALTGVFANSNQINLINNVLIILITVIFYWWYAENALERKGYIIRKRFYPEDVVLIINDFKAFLETRGALDSNKIDETEVKNFLDSKNIRIQEAESLEVGKEAKFGVTEEETTENEETNNIN